MSRKAKRIALVVFIICLIFMFDQDVVELYDAILWDTGEQWA